MKMVEVSTGDLIGRGLNWVMATIEGLPIRHDPMGFGLTANGGYWVWDDAPNGRKQKLAVPPSEDSRNSFNYYSPSTDWSQLGPLILKYPIVLGNHESGEDDGKFWGSAHCFFNGTSFDTKLGVMVAACRAIVALKRGAVVEVPEELLAA
ncbi:DUF2591 domain-containing protein [Pseudomonas syringae]|uniref:phage protein NinX family protein n=1 Tax=Pseudomonas syringae TaxID=317 RepID=UPI001F3FEF14|nr:phage protein NinX family protein [Pseudomonas syringae]MCF5381975.1 DUF2591 domain-containing protein [Pseudomonas syringae]MCF5419493.1 DUF2591 domain-containing protein [Pseudomonas syringae]MCF5454833.1 DUF2591 domain-containing protein [Pseudomonas syringae]MCF5456325.1 DUF2591 domain-containing protein [Pseudomonas syringae]